MTRTMEVVVIWNGPGWYGAAQVGSPEDQPDHIRVDDFSVSLEKARAILSILRA